MKRSVTMAVCIAMALPLLAQGERDSRKEREQRIQSEKIAFFTSELDLSPVEAEKFWPVYNRYWKDCMEAHHNTMEALGHICGKDGEKPASDRMEEYTDAYVEAFAAEQNVLKKYYPEFKKVLPIEKVGALFRAEEKFRMKMIHGLKAPDNKGKERGWHRNK